MVDNLLDVISDYLNVSLQLILTYSYRLLWLSAT